ncbi:MAG: DEAD/DEAH box helicase family protein [Verrucomicrobiaceae bacterium]|nr:DEAD/DEAH box helicase family protein [Verrucomicrobiaceae bacterium]
MNEAETRAEHIDPALKAAGWGVVEGSRIRREYPITTGRLEGNGKKGKALTADYILEYKNTKLAVNEAKAWDLPLTEGAAQAKNYAGKLALRHAYCTNGQGIYAIDMQTGVEKEIPAYPTPDELWAMTFAEVNAWRDRFAAVPLDTPGGKRAYYYQETAIERVLEAIAAGKDRILLTLATGTGKTFIAFQIAWKLFQARWNLSGEPTRMPRILFLADRNILANQAYNAFSAFPEDALVRIEPGEIKKKGKVPKNGNLFFTIFQTFLSGPSESAYFGEYPEDFFDFIIIDECHRGGANDESTWRDILNYFKPAVQLGLTATPKRKDNVDTYQYFGEPVSVYSLKEGINDGFLTPFRVKRVEIFMSQINQKQKTLVFCASQEHALLVRDLINQTKTSTDPNSCHRVTANDGALGEQHLRDFQNNDNVIPTILTTSQKLSTGVDARNIRNIVLMRPVNSMIEFKQIIGRGTRLFDGKDYFTIYDFVKAHQHFHDEEWDGPPNDPELCKKCGQYPCVCEVPPPPPCQECGETPCVCPCPKCSQRPCQCGGKKKAKVKLADGKARTIQHMMMTTFWHPDGTPMSSQQFMDLLFGKLPDFFTNEDELRALWSDPLTRKKLLEGLEEKGFGKSQLHEMQTIIEAEKSDLFDVLAHVAYALPTLSREERAAKAKVEISTHFNSKQQVFLDFVLSHYVSVGVEELDQDKLTPLLKLKYHDSIQDAVADLGSDVGKAFAGFQKYLYHELRYLS